MQNFRPLNFFKPLIKRIIGPLLKTEPFLKFKYKLLEKRYSSYSDVRRFDWAWDQVNFNRIALVNYLINKIENPHYLEIGTFSNLLFDSVPVLNKVGVDPVFGGNVRKTSDEFFLNNDSYFDVIFIDGLHTYEQVRRDVYNSIRFLKRGGVIAIHDMLPRNWVEQHIPNISPGPWVGDVWKVAFELSKIQGINFKIIKIDYGIGVLTLETSDPEYFSNLIYDTETIMMELRDKKFSFFYDNIQNLPIISWHEAIDLLSGARS
jgi:Methyltransferase domain